MHKRGSGDKTKSAALCFRTQNDALNFASHVCKDGHDWLAANNLNFAKRYEKGECVVVLKLSAGPDLPQYDLIFFAVPPEGTWVGNLRRAFNKPATTLNLVQGDAKLNQGLMLRCITRSVQCPNKIIPSFVWFEAAKKRQDIRRNIFATSATNNIRFKFVGAVGNRKVRTLRIRSTAHHRANVPHLIERGTKPLNYLRSESRKLGRDALNELAFVNCANSVRINLLDASVGVSFKEFGNPPIKVTDVLLCATESLLGTSEGVNFFHVLSLIQFFGSRLLCLFLRLDKQFKRLSDRITKKASSRWATSEPPSSKKMRIHPAIFAGDQHAGCQLNLYCPRESSVGRSSVKVYEGGGAAVSEGWRFRECGKFGFLGHDNHS
jgi:hypothetical protein